MNALVHAVLRRETIVPPVRLPRWVWVVGSLLLVIVAVIVPLYATPFSNYTLSMIMIYAVAGMGLNLLTGYSGQISIGHNFFLAVGAYTAAVMGKEGLNLLLAFPVAAVLCFVVGFALGLPALRMGALEFALVTLTLSLIIPAIVNRLAGLTGGNDGMTIDFDNPVTGLASDQVLYYGCLIVAVVGEIVLLRLSSARVGRALIAIRDYEDVARSVGARSSLMKTQAFAVSATFAGVAGVLYGLVVGYVAPDSFGINMSIAFITMIVVGGLATPLGAVVGAVFVVMVPQVASGLNGSSAIYGAALIACVFFLSTGVVGACRRLVRALQHRRCRVGRSSPIGERTLSNTWH